MIFSTDSSIIDSQTKLPHFSDAPTDEPKDTLNYRDGLAVKKNVMISFYCSTANILMQTCGSKYTEADLWF